MENMILHFTSIHEQVTSIFRACLSKHLEISMKNATFFGESCTNMLVDAREVLGSARKLQNHVLHAKMYSQKIYLVLKGLTAFKKLSFEKFCRISKKKAKKVQFFAIFSFFFGGGFVEGVEYST